MKARVATIFIAWSVCATSVDAQVDQCLELVRLSRMSSRTIMSQSQFASTLNAYCDEREQVDARSGSVGISGFGSASAARTAASYAKFCGKSAEDRGNESDYQEYVEGVQPGAYAAYAACTTARESDEVQYEMGQSPTRDRFVLGVWNQTDIRATAELEWSGSAPVACEWTSQEVTPEGRARLQPNERATLECRRSAFDVAPIREPDSVNVIRVDGGRAPMLVIPWSKYGPDDMPVQTLVDVRRSMEQEIAALSVAIRELTTEPRVQSGTVGISRYRELTDLIYRPELVSRDGADRGVTGGRVDFEKPFSSTPEVMVALRFLDVGDTTTRIRVNVTAVDPEGFNYDFVTWSGTDINTAIANWIAVARD